MLAREFFLKLVCAGLTAEVIGMPPDFFGNRCSPWNKYQADGILYHVVLSRGELIWLAPPFDLHDGASDEKIQGDK